MEKILEQKKRFGFPMLLIVLILALIFIFILKVAINKNNPRTITTYIDGANPAFEHKDIGKIESIIKYGDNSIIAVHYPVFDNQVLDKKTLDFIKNRIDNFHSLFEDQLALGENYRFELNIDYEVYKSAKDIVSIKFSILEYAPYYPNPKLDIETFVYDLSKSCELSLSDIMKGKYLETISDNCIKYFREKSEFKEYIDTASFIHGTKPVENNFSDFILVEDGIIFIFQRSKLFPNHIGESEVKIYYDSLEDHIKPRYKVIDSIETFVAEDDVEPALEIIHSRKIDPNMPMIALTFDDGPYYKTTIPILNVLKEHDSVATFFVLGNRVPRNKDILQRMIREGNEIGNHSYNHKQLTTLSSSELKDQIDRTQNAIMEVVGSRPKIMRPTYGSYNNRIKSEVQMPMILWSIDTQDWKNRNAEKISSHVIANARDGDIILMHDLYESTAEAVEIIVPALINKGFQLVTISELYEIRGEILEVGNIYSHSTQK